MPKGTIGGAGVGVALVTAAALGNVGSNVMPVVLPGIASRFHLSDTSSGIVATVQLLATALAALAAAPWASRPGRIRFARLGLLLAAAGLITACIAPNFTTLILSNLIAGAGLGVVYAAGMAAIAATEDTDRASAVAVVGATILIALLIIALPMANDSWGGAAAFALLAALCLPALWCVRAMPDAAERTTEQHSTAPPPMLFVLALVLLGATEQGAWSYSEVLGENHAGLSADTVSVVLSVVSVASLAGVGLSAWAVRRFGRLPTVAVFFAVEAMAKLTVASTASGNGFITAVTVWQICYMALLVQVLAVAASADRSGRWVAAASGAVAVGTGLGPAPAGWILDSIGAPAFGLVLAVATLLAAIPLLRTTRLVARFGLPHRAAPHGHPTTLTEGDSPAANVVADLTT
ncbi:MAG: MFS transporter [Catenulispora sp.]|nr:MFS transporter [Catenulispora sp.]